MHGHDRSIHLETHVPLRRSGRPILQHVHQLAVVRPHLLRVLDLVPPPGLKRLLKERRVVLERPLDELCAFFEGLADD